MDQPRTTPEEHTPDPKGIVSVNSRTGASNNMIGKIIFVIAVGAIVLIGALIGYNKHRAASKVASAAEQQKAKNENKPAATGPRRTFDTDPPPLPGAQPKAVSGDGYNKQGSACADGTPGIAMVGQDGKPLKSADGSVMRVCKDGRVVVPALQPSQTGAAPIAVTGNPQAHQVQPQRVSRYTVDVMIASLGSNTAAIVSKSQKESVTAAALAALNNIGAGNRQPQNSFVSTTANTSDSSSGSSSPPGSI